MSGDDLVSMRRGDSQAGRPPVNRGGIIDLMLALVAVIAVGSLGYFGFSYWLASHSTPPASPPPAAAATRPGMATEVAWTEADTAHCRAAAGAVADARVPDEFMLAKQSVTPGFAALATSIECKLSRKTSRFCDPTEKAALVAMINDYLGRLDLVKLGMAVEGAPMVAMGEIFGGEISGGSDMYQLERDQTLGFMQSYHVRISKRLQALGLDGIISAGDFGSLLGVPAVIADVFAGIEPQRQLCA